MCHIFCICSLYISSEIFQIKTRLSAPLSSPQCPWVSPSWRSMPLFGKGVFPKHRVPHPVFHPEFFPGCIVGQQWQWLDLNLVETNNGQQILCFSLFYTLQACSMPFFDSKWMQPSICTQSSWPSQLWVIPGGLWLVVFPWFLFSKLVTVLTFSLS